MAFSGRVEPLITPIPGEPCPLLWAALAAKNPPKRYEKEAGITSGMV